MSKQLAKLTVRFNPEDKAVAFLRLDGVGIRQFEQLSIQYRRINKVDTTTKSAIIRWIIAQYTNTPCDLESLQSYCVTQNIRLQRLFELALCAAMQRQLGKIV